ncbi:endonuclease/exonuclease/phosphatase family protein [Aquamicrobium terrae]|uniref:Endonuclease/exonuclease/phosphatase family metal-dependent hydrolase n=1 Tax=Aquamicrobium terrae TaxID=1324945 RepID=A0ABV2N2U8_9HYPH
MQKLGSGLPASILERIRMRRNHAGHVPAVEHGGQSGLVVASYNVHKCVGTDGRFDPERTSRVIHEIGADVIALQEADKRFGNREGLLDLTRLEREAGLTLVPVFGKAKAHGWHGNVVLFRRGAVRDVHQFKLPGLEPRGAIMTEIDLEAGGSIRIVAAHFGLLRHSRTLQARMILDIMNASAETPTLLMGDLNEWRLNDRSALAMFEAAFGPLPPAVPSFPSRLPLLALDRIIANRTDIVSPVMAHDTPLARVASDHLPIKAFVKLAADGEDAQGERRAA